MPRVNHFEIVIDDPERTIKFYETVFGWTTEKWDGPIDYWNVRTGDPNEPGIDGGFRRRNDAISVNTINVDDIDHCVKLIEENGGEIVKLKGLVRGVGWLAYFKDTEGNLWGMMQEDHNSK